ncbi:hypothetical protein D3C76_301870 [compost metagenome]
MGLPVWLCRAIEERLDEVSAHIEQHSEIRQVRKEERKAFYAMFEDENFIKSPTFRIWEDQHHFKQSLINEQLYKQGMKDGMQLVFSLLDYADVTPSDKKIPTTTT